MEDVQQIYREELNNYRRKKVPIVVIGDNIPKRGDEKNYESSVNWGRNWNTTDTKRSKPKSEDMSPADHKKYMSNQNVNYKKGHFTLN